MTDEVEPNPDASKREREPDSFGGAWLVTEYVHDPDGTFVGTVRQRREVSPGDDGRLRVTQRCEPSASLADHPMGAFTGEWVFDLEVHGAERHYLGPDVIGVGVEWAPGAMTGQGLWPRFGYAFESYGVLVAPDRQLTGGFFSLAGRSVADIVGVAVPESLGIEPTLDREVAPMQLGPEWPLHRQVGPMTVAESRPSPTERRRLWTMPDPIGGHALSVRITDRTAGGRSATIEVHPFT